jgi:hypothetical protein
LPNDLYIGIAIGVVILILLASLFRRKPAARRTAQNTRSTSIAQTSSANASVSPDELKIQLSRIADSLAKIEAHLGISAPEMQPTHSPAQSPSTAPITPPAQTVQKSPDAVGAQQAKTEQLESVQEKTEEARSEQSQADKPASHVSLSMFGR